MCKIDFDGDYEVVGFTRRDRKAKKVHRCDLCHGSIAPGEAYEYASWIYDHEPSWQKVCVACTADMAEFSKAHHVVLLADTFMEYLTECIAEGDPESEAWIPMRDRIKERIQRARAARAQATPS